MLSGAGPGGRRIAHQHIQLQHPGEELVHPFLGVGHHVQGADSGRPDGVGGPVVHGDVVGMSGLPVRRERQHRVRRDVAEQLGDPFGPFTAIDSGATAVGVPQPAMFAHAEYPQTLGQLGLPDGG